MGARKVSRQTHQRILGMIRTGMSYSQIADELDIPKSTVYYNAKKKLKHDYDERTVCGTDYGYLQHLRRDERPCLICCDAHAKKMRKYRKSQKSQGL